MAAFLKTEVEMTIARVAGLQCNAKALETSDHGRDLLSYDIIMHAVTGTLGTQAPEGIALCLASETET